MATLWDETNQRHIIKIGIKTYNLEGATISSSGQAIVPLQNTIRNAINAQLLSEGMRCEIKIITKSPVFYHLWIGPIGSNPSSDFGV